MFPSQRSHHPDQAEEEKEAMTESDLAREREAMKANRQLARELHNAAKEYADRADEYEKKIAAAEAAQKPQYSLTELEVHVLHDCPEGPKTLAVATLLR